MNTTATSFSTRTGFRANNGVRGFFLPKADEFLAFDRSKKFEEVCDELRSTKREDHLIRQSDMKVRFDENGAILGFFRDEELLTDPKTGRPQAYEIDLDAPFLNQTATDLGIDGAFIRKMIDSNVPDWTNAANALVNLGLRLPLKEDQDGDRKRMIRLFEDKDTGRMMATANVSNGFLRIDNDPLADWVWALRQSSNLMPLHWDYQKGDFCMHAVIPTPRNVALPGGPTDEMFFGITIRNSMTGGSALAVNSFTFRRVCDNGMMRMLNSIAMRRAHRGRRQHQVGVLGDTAYEQRAISEILHTAAINTRRLLEDDVIDAEVVSMQEAQRQTFAGALTMSMVEADPVRRAMAKALDISQQDAGLVLTNLLTSPNGFGQDDSLSKWGLANAITATAHGMPESKARDFMGLGGRVLDWGGNQFEHTMDGLWNAFRR